MITASASKKNAFSETCCSRQLFNASSYPVGIVGHLTDATWGHFPHEAGHGSKESSAAIVIAVTDSLGDWCVQD